MCATCNKMIGGDLKHCQRRSCGDSTTRYPSRRTSCVPMYLLTDKNLRKMDLTVTMQPETPVRHDVLAEREGGERDTKTNKTQNHHSPPPQGTPPGCLPRRSAGSNMRERESHCRSSGPYPSQSTKYWNPRPRRRTSNISLTVSAG